MCKEDKAGQRARRFTADEYLRMAEAGLLPERGVELLDGEIVEMRGDGGLHPRRFTAEEYLRMVELGILGEDERVELLGGEIVEMSPQSDAQVASLERATQALVLAYAGSGYAVRVRSTHRAGSRSMSEPDLAVVVAGTDRVLDVSESVLLIDVADAALANNRTGKRQLYAEAGAPRYWIVEIFERQVRVLEEPDGGDYAAERVVGEQGALTLPVIGTAVAVAGILPAR